MRQWLCFVSCVWTLCAVGLDRLAIADEYSEAATRPNILFIIADDASRDSMGSKAVLMSRHPTSI